MDAAVPKPFRQSDQYKKNFNASSVDEDLQVDPPKSKKLAKSKKKKKKANKVKKVRPDISKIDLEKCGSEYQANMYSKIRRAFIDKVRNDRGISVKEANEEWNRSSQKRKMLSGVSTSELRRRRFIPKGCDHNPWADVDQDA